MHISAMANTYVKDPRKVAKPGDVVRVKVLEVDTKRRQIALTMRSMKSRKRGQLLHEPRSPQRHRKNLQDLPRYAHA